MGHRSTLLCPSCTSTGCEGRVEICQSSAGGMELLATPSKLLRAVEADQTYSF